MRIQEQKFNQELLVEGNDDQHVIWALLKKHSISETFKVIDRTGYPALLDSLPPMLTASSAVIQTIGIVIDADTNIETRWKSMRDQLSPYISLPISPPSNGYIGDTTRNPIKRIGIWVMPDNTAPGMLENFIHLLISDDDELITHCDQFLSTIEELKLNRYRDIHKAKARIHTWLAVQEDPSTPMGQAITKKYLATDNPICQSFIQWINLLFNPPPHTSY